MKMDAKFYGTLRKVKNDEIVSEEEWICFLVKDNAFFSILPSYLSKCIELKCDDEQVQAVKRMIRRAELWRISNPDRLKNPDAKNEKLMDISSNYTND